MKRIYTPRPVVASRPIAGPRSLALNRVPIVAPNNGKPNVILDTNILITALIARSQKHTDSASYRVILELKKESFNLIMPNHLLEEYKVDLPLAAAKLKESKNIVITASMIDEIIEFVGSVGSYGRANVIPNIVPNDIDDAQIFNTSLICSVDYVVTTDARDLIKHRNNIPNLPSSLKIVTPNDFLRKLAELMIKIKKI